MSFVRSNISAPGAQYTVEDPYFIVFDRMFFIVDLLIYPKFCNSYFDNFQQLKKM